MLGSEESHRKPVNNDDRLEDTQDDYLQELICATLNQQEESAEVAIRARKRAEEIELIAASTAKTLYGQGEQLSRIDAQTEQMDDKISEASKKTDYLTKLNRSFLIPVFGCSGQSISSLEQLNTSQKSNSVQIVSVLANEAAKDENGKPILQPRKMLNRASRTEQVMRKPQNSENEESQNAEDETHNRSQKAEEEIDNALTGISKAVSNMKLIAVAIDKELDVQSEILENNARRAEKQNVKIKKVNRKVNKLLSS